ncbi:MAG: Protein translocase subunit SecD [Candidatus Moranbacteria bacterium GW2011_GWE2_35_2-]|nr:MAG: Protein translocase subunit SecD [Candidatus Moranbacteria bacterium GW2011_GWE2_35_2-]KKQ05085.1 MAG: Protein translocase subunit SecD [Candidatus Moranbacteria bacterium GW2011_GWF1_36_4]KKQ22820.1 MAG: Protein translocase subunit SecD [Candidatus Moranbacteria bacterium GW2011_GWF2_37_11]KKQ30949.1 MAG: Protein translocase subunit SecD [Candidatus Moranbacteria bacterium GW2011_GWE1_37_24]KKQ47700.1 MAG: Protein translocase subunit SecD [Candidatus Moranbacteria bacterium GW2011_GWD2
MNVIKKTRIKFASIIILAVLAGIVSYPRVVKFISPIYESINKLKINLGLDLQGGIHLEYDADLSKIDSSKIEESMQAVQDVIERRVNAFGVAEPTIYTTKSGEQRRLIVELAGIKDINQAKNLIKETPLLEFKREIDPNDQKIKNVLDPINEQSKKQAEYVLAQALAENSNFEELAKEYSQDPGSKDAGGDLGFVKKGEFVEEFDAILFNDDVKNGQIYPDLIETLYGWHIIKKMESREEGGEKEVRAEHILFAKATIDMFADLKYEATGLTGKNLKNATVEFASQGLSEPQVALKFDNEGTKLFSELTKNNIGKSIAIYLDGEIISAPTVQVEITNGEAVITGNFSLDEAKDLVKRLNEGALPVPINLVSQESVDASLGEKSLITSLKAGYIGLGLVMLFMIAYYRFLGLIASIALLIYAALMVSIFKLSGLTPWQITLTLPGIAGFILSVGMAVDANILIFERTKEEIRKGRTITGALDEGFKRAWTSIRDGNFSSIITSFILIELGTGFVKGFAITLIVGVLLSMFTAIIISRTLLNFILGEWISNKLWLVGLKKEDTQKNN